MTEIGGVSGPQLRSRGVLPFRIIRQRTATMALEEKMRNVEQGVVTRTAARMAARHHVWPGVILWAFGVLVVALVVLAARHRPLNRSDFPKLNALQWAAVTNNQSECERLIHAGTPVDAADVDGKTALHKAVFYCHLDVVRTLLDLGADSHHLDRFDRSPIMVAEGLVDGGRGPGTREQYAAILELLKRGK